MEFIIILLGLVVFHEFGHYIAAKLSGVRVEEFGFGLPPRLFGRKFGKVKPGQEDERTLWSVNALPIGGFVRLTGEDATYIDRGDAKNFQNAKLWKRMLIVLAGVFINFVLGIALFAIVYSVMGIPENPRVVVSDVTADSPAAQAGIQKEDEIVSLNGTAITNYAQMQSIVKENFGKSIAVVVRRAGSEVSYQISPYKRTVEGVEVPVIGVGISQKVDFKRYPWYEMPFYGVASGLHDTVELSKQILPTLSNLVVQLVSHRTVPEGVGGPVRIYQASQLFCSSGILACLQFAGLISVNLALFNLLPIPALDGGRFAFMLYEAVTRRRVPAKLEQWSYAVSFALLILLLVFVTYNDVTTKFVLK